MAAIVQWLERLIVVQKVEGSNPSSRPLSFQFNNISKFISLILLNLTVRFEENESETRLFLIFQI